MSSNPTNNTSIYLDNNSIEKANVIITQENDYKLPIDIDPMNHNRQLRSKFSHISTFCLARCYSDFAVSTNLQPYTIQKSKKRISQSLFQKRRRHQYTNH